MNMEQVLNNYCTRAMRTDVEWPGVAMVTAVLLMHEPLLANVPTPTNEAYILNPLEV
jgi:hypothetical protein